MSQHFDLVVLGGGPGGYAAAIRASQLGLSVAVIESKKVGGVCLHEGCIPSKALLHAADLFHRIAHEAGKIGIRVSNPELEVEQLQKWKGSVVHKLHSGVSELLRRHNIVLIEGRGEIFDSHSIDVAEERISFRHLILATGSREIELSTLPLGDLIWSAREALSFPELPKKLAIVGAGVIGLEMGQLFARLGTKVEIFEILPGLFPERDGRTVRELRSSLEADGLHFHFESRVLGHEGSELIWEEKGEKKQAHFDKILVAIGRKPQSSGIGLEKIRVAVDEKGYVRVNERLQTAISHIYAIGDLVAGPLLAHRATAMGLLAAENIAGEKLPFDPKVIPAVVYTEPSLAWVGLSESQAKAKNLSVKVSRFPLAANGRSLTSNDEKGSVCLVIDAADGRILGADIVSPAADQLISEITLAIEMSATDKDLSLTIHPHPSLSESLVEAAEAAHQMAIHLFMRPTKS